GGRTVIGLGEITQRQRQGNWLVVRVDRLNDQVLPLLHVREQFGGYIVIRHAAIGEADHIRALRRWIAVDDYARAVHEQHAERERDAEDFLVLALGLDHHGRNDRLTGLDTAILAGKTYLLGIGILALEAKLGPGRIDQWNLLIGRLGRRSRGRRGLLRARCGCRRRGLRRSLGRSSLRLRRR